MRDKGAKGKGPSKALITYSNKRRKDGASSSQQSNTTSRTMNPKVPETHEINLSNNEERAVFASLVTRGIEKTQFPSKEVLVSLGLYDNVKELFDNIGWGDFIDDTIQDRRTYSKVVLEMLSTFDTTHMNINRSVKFQLFGSKHVMSYEDIDNAFNVPHGGDQLVDRTFDVQSIWRKLAPNSEEGFRAGYSKSNEVRNPVLRMVLKILGHTIIARSENTSVRNDDLFILHAMLTERSISFCDLFLPQLKKQAQSDGGKINIGGMLTPIARKIRSNLGGYPPMSGEFLLDTVKLRRLRFLKSSSPPYYFLITKTELYPLPNVMSILVTNFEERMNWYLDTPEHMMIMKDKIFNQGEGDEYSLGGRGGERNRMDEDEDMEESDEPLRDEQGSSEPIYDERFEALESRMTNMEGGFKSLDAQVTVMRHEMTSMRITQLEEARRSERMEALLESFREYQISQGATWPRPPPK